MRWCLLLKVCKGAGLRTVLIGLFIHINECICSVEDPIKLELEPNKVDLHKRPDRNRLVREKLCKVYIVHL